MKKIEANTCIVFEETERRRQKTLSIGITGSHPSSYCRLCYWLGVLCPR